MKYFYQILTIFALLGLWQLGSDELIPSPKESFMALCEIVQKGVLQTGIIDSLYRYFWGLVAGLSGGILVIFIFGLFPKVSVAFDPIINLLRPVSPIAWVPLVLIIFGIGDKPTIFIISYAVFFPVLLLASKAVQDVPKELIIVSKNFGASKWQVLSGVIFPSSFLILISGLKLAASLAWINLVVGEMLGAQTGLGYLIIDARNQLRIDIVLAVICVIGVVDWAINQLFCLIEKQISRKFGYDKNL
ncbi:ABC transporter permease [Campylobacter hyointestinalis]|uniref:Taurine ABC transporter permease n=1 Tax=Campylobacter hyointestinalis subsp. hyointestinalis TaxID=91352 RepID=A0A855NDX7_CAMHY|nr:ABC transporter permease [Campylobacter hyointestinalis]PPB60208.1 taurine ABC transporter permease [Campylobacter hyointestinalis subsp. hyointestinalis]PPB63834.1 taurine ABC transporter permease [Campylobacter hyointestinalis subsp. hyointestinalis]PPB73131.1 taurine ABC transporter permease [Campylobacter hyointestinalis subsp. hyointestinalis]